MKFYQFLNEGRTQSINRKTAIDLLTKHCKDSMLYPLFRDVKDANYEYGFVDPKNASHSERKSPYAHSNHYNLLLSNLPSWRKLPKRNASLVCTTHDYDAFERSQREHFYAVVPFDGSDIGVCSDEDIWYSFKNLPLNTLNEINVFFSDLDISDDSWENMKRDLTKLDKEFKRDYMSVFNSTYSKSILRVFKDSGKKTFLSFLDDVMSLE